MEENPPSEPKQKESWTGVIIVIIVIALGGAYFWYVKSGAMNELDERNRVLEEQAKNATNLFK